MIETISEPEAPFKTRYLIEMNLSLEMNLQNSIFRDGTSECRLRSRGFNLESPCLCIKSVGLIKIEPSSPPQMPVSYAESHVCTKICQGH